jgi:hypothetical protein
MGGLCPVGVLAMVALSTWEGVALFWAVDKGNAASRGEGQNPVDVGRGQRPQQPVQLQEIEGNGRQFESPGR